MSKLEALLKIEKPILFSALMVRAILEGRKIQTRRVIKPQPTGSYAAFSWDGKKSAPRGKTGGQGHYNSSREDIDYWMRFHCPYGSPEFVCTGWPEKSRDAGRLWVREAWRTERCELNSWKPSELAPDTCIVFDADGDWSANKTVGRYRPGMFMPRWASRITLEIADVRVERLQDISRGDAMDEGCPFPNLNGDEGRTDPVGWYRGLWESINGADSWDANPFVWVVSFRRIA